MERPGPKGAGDVTFALEASVTRLIGQRHPATSKGPPRRLQSKGVACHPRSQANGSTGTGTGTG